MRCGAFHRVEGTLCLGRNGQAPLSGSKTKAPGFAGGYLLTCSFKQISVPPKAVCSMDGQDIAQFLLREGWAELPIDVTDQAYVEASELAHSRGLGIWGDGPPLAKPAQAAPAVERLAIGGN